MRALLRATAVLVATCVLFWLMFALGFYATATTPPGWSCHPTFTFGYSCTGPDGQRLRGR